MNKYLNIYWAENTNPRGGRFIIADSIADATKLALDSGMVKDIRNLIITKEPEDKYKDTNIKESGCTESLHGKKSRCIINIVPQEDKEPTFQVDSKCITQLQS